MEITINYFASLREEVGHGKNTLNLEVDKVSVNQIWRLATDQMVVPTNVLVAINQEYVSWDAFVLDGDEVAFFPPVTGG
ncbi:MAG: MoaD/ThiS family protein [Cocleimonas sp.]|nr:MoaD/ThiS family protein [Cocleimonas sp.]